MELVDQIIHSLSAIFTNEAIGSLFRELMRFIGSLDLKTSLVALVLLAVCVPFALSFLSSFGFRLWRALFPYPKTPFGFRGQLIYSDNKNEATFVDHNYKVSARPDFIYRLQNGRYMLVELKSAHTLQEGHIAQAFVSVLAARTRYKVTRIMVVTGNSKQHNITGGDKSSSSIYRRWKKDIESARQIVNRKNTLPEPKLESKCDKCFMYALCHSS